MTHRTSSPVSRLEMRWVMAHISESCHIWMNMYKSNIQHYKNMDLRCDKSWHISLSHITYGWTCTCRTYKMTRTRTWGAVSHVSRLETCISSYSDEYVILVWHAQTSMSYSYEYVQSQIGMLCNGTHSYVVRWLWQDLTYVVRATLRFVIRWLWQVLTCVVRDLTYDMTYVVPWQICGTSLSHTTRVCRYVSYTRVSKECVYVGLI